MEKNKLVSWQYFLFKNNIFKQNPAHYYKETLQGKGKQANIPFFYDKNSFSYNLGLIDENIYNQKKKTPNMDKFQGFKSRTFKDTKARWRFNWVTKRGEKIIEVTSYNPINRDVTANYLKYHELILFSSKFLINAYKNNIFSLLLKNNIGEWSPLWELFVNQAGTESMSSKYKELKTSPTLLKKLDAKGSEDFFNRVFKMEQEGYVYCLSGSLYLYYYIKKWDRYYPLKLKGAWKKGQYTLDYDIVMDWWYLYNDLWAKLLKWTKWKGGFRSTIDEKYQFVHTANLRKFKDVVKKLKY